MEHIKQEQRETVYTIRATKNELLCLLSAIRCVAKNKVHKDLQMLIEPIYHNLEDILEIYQSDDFPCDVYNYTDNEDLGKFVED